MKSYDKKSKRDLIKEIKKLNNKIDKLEKVKESFFELEQLYNCFLKISPVIITISDLEGNIKWTSPSTAKILGIDNIEQIIGKSAYEFIAPEQRARALENMKKTLMQGIIFNEEYIFLRPDNTRYFGELSASLIIDKQGKPKGLIAIIHDLTKLKASEESIRETEENFRSLAEKSPNMIFINQKGRVVYANDKCSEIMGYSKDEFLNENFNFYSLIDPEYIEFIKQSYSKHLKGEEVPPYEYKLITKDKKKLDVIISTRLIKFRGEDALLGVVTDITEFKKIQADKKKIESQLLHSQKIEALGRLAGGIAHDFNNILLAIIGYSELAIMNYKENKDSVNELEEIKNAGLRASKLTKQLLTFSRQQDLEKCDINLNSLIVDIKKMLIHIIGEDIKLILELQDDLLFINADPGQIEQVIMNLVINSHSAMPNGGIIKIKTKNINIDQNNISQFTEAKFGRYVCLSINDTGKGMDNEVKRHLFEPFFTTKEEGTGLGLSVVYGIVKKHDGWIEVESELNKGTIINIYLPAILEKQDIKKISDKNLNAFNGKGKKILLVEDDEKVLDYTKTALIKNGYNVMIARNSVEAQNIFNDKDHKIDLLLSDVILPDSSGLQLAEELIKKYKNLKILLSSGYSEQKSQRPIIIKKGFNYIQKPYSLYELLKSLYEILNEDEINAREGI